MKIAVNEGAEFEAAKAEWRGYLKGIVSSMMSRKTKSQSPKSTTRTMTHFSQLTHKSRTQLQRLLPGCELANPKTKFEKAVIEIAATEPNVKNPFEAAAIRNPESYNEYRALKEGAR